MAVKNVVIGTEPKNRKPYTKKVKPEISTNETNSKFPKNESFEFFIGKNLDNGTDPIDDLLNGKKIIYKKKWIIWRTNHNKGGKIMTDKEAFESGPNASDDYFGRAWREKEFICKNRKTQVIDFQDVDFYKFCDYLNGLK